MLGLKSLLPKQKEEKLNLSKVDSIFILYLFTLSTNKSNEKSQSSCSWNRFYRTCPH